MKSTEKIVSFIFSLANCVHIISQLHTIVRTVAVLPCFYVVVCSIPSRPRRHFPCYSLLLPCVLSSVNASISDILLGVGS